MRPNRHEPVPQPEPDAEAPESGVHDIVLPEVTITDSPHSEPNEVINTAITRVRGRKPPRRKHRTVAEKDPSAESNPATVARVSEVAEQVTTEMVDRLNKGEEVTLDAMLQQFAAGVIARNGKGSVHEGAVRLLKGKIAESRDMYEVLGKKETVARLNALLRRIDKGFELRNLKGVNDLP